MTLPNCCPTCNRPLQNGSQPAGKRFCVDCGRHMGKRDKWSIGTDSKLHHKNCALPTGEPVNYKPKGLFN